MNVIPPLASVGQIDVPASIRDHRFMLEALANCMLAETREDPRMRVVGTVNIKSPELYGWGPNVAEHVDRTGFVYLAPLLVFGESTLFVRHGKRPKRIALQVGRVIRLNDHEPHWTIDDGKVVCVFIGSFPWPCDADAVEKLRGAVTALADGDYYDAPRVAPGRRLMLPDECLAWRDTPDDVRPMLLADAKRDGYVIEKCGKCKRRNAARLDHHHPYYADGNRCMRCLRAAEKARP